MVVAFMEIYNFKTFLDTLIRRRIMHSWADIFRDLVIIMFSLFKSERIL